MTLVKTHQQSIGPRRAINAAISAALGLFAAVVDVVDDAPGLGFLGRHEVVAIQGLFDFLIRPAGVVDVDLVQAALGGDDVLGVALDVRGLAAEAARGLVHHDPGVRQGDPLARLAGRQDQGAGRGRHAHDHGRNRALDVLHHLGSGNYAEALAGLTEIRSARMRDEMTALVELAQEYGPIESAADNLINRLMSVSKDGQVIELNTHMREFLDRAVKIHPPQSDTTANTIRKLQRGEKLSETEAKDLSAYLEEAKLKVIPQGKRSSLLTEQIKGLQNRYEQEVAKSGETIRSFFPR